MKTFGEFQDYIRENILIGWKENATVKIEEIRKNNGIAYTGVIIKEKSSTIAPIVYIDVYYRCYLDGEKLEVILDYIREDYEEKKHKISKESMSIYTEELQDFSLIKERIFYQLINFSRNKERLKNVPNIQIFDMSIVFRILFSESRKGTQSILVTKKEVKIWNVGLRELMYVAQTNTRQLFPEKILDLNDFLGMHSLTDGTDIVPISIATNTQCINGASVIFYEGFFEKFANEHGGDFFIVPSTIHEILLIPSVYIPHPEKLPDILSKINKIICNQEDILSDHLFLYKADEKKIKKLE